MTYVERLRELLSRAVEKTCEPELGIIFSGGIDSTIIALLASEYSQVTAYSCGIKGSPDIGYVDECGNLDFRVKVVELDPGEIERSLADIIQAIGDINPVKVSVEVPFYFASKKAMEDGLSVMLCGQGADELFGGYNRYLGPLPDYDVVGKMMSEDVENIYAQQISKDMAVCKVNGVELRAPYMDDEFRNYAMGIPVELKLHEVKDSPEFSCVDIVNDRRFIRKYILRKLGEEIGVPDAILNRRKKAAQYGSGTWKVFDKIARQREFKEKARKAGRKDYVGMWLSSIQ